MANFAIIENGVVTNIIIADSKEIAEAATGLTAIQYDPDNHEAGMGYGYEKGKFIAPISPEPKRPVLPKDNS